MRRSFPSLAASLLLIGAAPPSAHEAAAIRGDVAYLASDALRGREAGTPDYDAAAGYVARAFAAAGLRPGGEAGSYLQHVPLVRYTAAASRLVLDGAGGPGTLAEGVDYRALAVPSAAHTRVAARLVFAGYGVSMPSRGLDDYAGIDARGAIVAFVGGAPAGLVDDEHAYAASLTAKLRAAQRHGAVGAVLLTGEGPGARAVDSGVAWAVPDGSGHADVAGVPLLAAFTAAGSARLFAGAARPWDSVRAAVDGVQHFPPEPLATRLAVESDTAFAPLPSANVIGVIPGADPVVGREVVVLSAHLDHIGVSAAPDAHGDRINNGALDDAIGIAILIAEAHRFRAAPPPRRTIVFLAVTAEEKGLIGSDWFLHHRPAGMADIVADVNLDMPILTYRFQDLVAFGGERSTLGPAIAHAARAAGVRLSPDPIPEEGIFVRSDHFRFVQQGIPAVYIWPGVKGPGRAAYEDFMRNRYHKPGDDMAQRIRWDQAARFAGIEYRIARDIADADRRPAWNAGEFFAAEFAR